MNFKLINLISFLLLLTYQNVASVEKDYFEKGLLFQLRQKSKSFESDIEVV